MEQIIEDIIASGDRRKNFYFVYGDEEISERILIDLLDRVGDDLKFIPESLIKGGENEFPLHNIKDAKYLVVTGVTECSNLDKGFVKSLVGGDQFWCSVSHNVISTQAPTIIIFCDNDPTDYLVTEQDIGFLHRLKVVMKDSDWYSLVCFS